MTLRTLIHRSLRFHWRSHLGVVIGAAIGSAALTGALVVGDSVKGSLRKSALDRLGDVTLALDGGDRIYRASLAEALQAEVRDRDSRPVAIAPVLALRGSVSTANASARVNQVSILGIEPASWAGLAGSTWSAGPLEDNAVLLSEALARTLGASEGDTLLIRFPRLSALSQEAVMVSRDAAAVTLRGHHAGVLGKGLLGGFSLRAAPAGAMNVFVNQRTLERLLDRSDAANLLLAPRHQPLQEPYRYDSVLNVALREGLAGVWSLQDAESHLEPRGRLGLELRSARIFLDPPIERAALAAETNAQPILTYIANLILSGTNATPYSMVTAAGAPWTPAGLADDEIILNQWLAEDLQSKPGDTVTLVYYDPESGARLTERTNTFRVHSVVPMEMPWADRTLMPDLPGIEKAESTADWDTAFPLTYKIRAKDDEYWREHRGTPKAFVTLAAGKTMWANRFGEVTAIRFPVPPGGMPGTPSTASQDVENGDAVKHVPAELYRDTLEQKILSHLDPAELGLRFEPVREQALKAAAESQDFGGLFIGFSLFLIAAALILMALLFQFGLEQRSAEVGTLLALGFTHRQVRRLLLGEGAALAFIGGVTGVVGGVFHANAMLLGLRTVWRDAIGGTTLDFFVRPVSLAIGLLASTTVAVITIWLALRKQARRPAIALLTARAGWLVEDHRLPRTPSGRIQSERSSKDPVESVPPARRGQHVLNAATIGSGSLLAAVGLAGWALVSGETTNAGVFFGAGSLVLMGGLALISWRLERGAGVPPASRKVALSPGRRDARATLTAGRLAFRGLARRRSRSVATAALLAAGSFLILSIGVFRLDANRDATKRTAGTGGFALIGEATLPVVQDLNTQAGRDAFALDPRELEAVEFVQFRERAGDEASCLNLNRAQKPRLLGVKPEALAGRFTFAKGAKGLDTGEGWQLLKSEIRIPKSEMEPVAAIGDANSIQWAMGRKVGDTIDYVDDRGQAFKVRIVGAVANSILQGNLIIDEAEFLKRFPNESGYQYFLIDAPPNRLTEISATLSRALQDHGLEVTPAVQRLNQFNAVQNTYLGTFQILGGLGLLLGSAGLGIVVLRNVLERRSELAVLMAVGFRTRNIERLVLMEHGGLLGLGLAVGLAAAAVAVLPTLLAPGAHLPYSTLVPTLLAVLLNGLVWTWLATRLALRGELLAALRNE